MKIKVKKSILNMYSLLGLIVSSSPLRWAQLPNNPGHTLRKELHHNDAEPWTTTESAGRSGFGVITLLPDARCEWTLAGP